MSDIACKECENTDCDGCNMFLLWKMLEAGKFNALTGETHSIDAKVDVRPVVRGRWIMTTERFAPERICSSCKCRFPVSAGEGITEVLNFCPNCGADMRGIDA